jgi:hypothetical protein
MTKPKTNRSVWLMIALLAVVVLGGLVMLFERYQSSLAMQVPDVSVLPRSHWGFGSVEYTVLVADLGTVGTHVVAERLKLGVIEVALYYR